MANFSFENIKKHDIKSKTAVYVFYDIEGEPWVECKPATESNRPYLSERLKRVSKNARTHGRKQMTAEHLSQDRDDDRILFPKHVIVNGGNFIDDKGKWHEYSSEVVKSFVEALPGWMFDDLRNWASDPRNFIEDDEIIIDEDDVEDTVKNS